MVVFDMVSAQLSTELTFVIPGDFNAKLAYLQQELKEHYPHVVITHSDCHLKVHGRLQEIVDLHSVLEVWFSTRDRSKQHNTSAIPPTGFTTELSSSLPSGSAIQNPLAVSSGYSIQYTTPNAGTPIGQLDTPTLNVDPQGNGDQTTEPHLLRHMAALPYPSGGNTGEREVIPPTNVEAGMSTEPDHKAVALNTSFTSVNSSSDETTLHDAESHNIKSFIKSFGDRKKNQEVQTDLPEMAPSPLSSGRRRKPGTPRKAKAHIPLKTDQPKGRPKKRPERFSDDDKTLKKKVGRPPKKIALDRVLPEEMIPIESELQTVDQPLHLNEVDVQTDVEGTEDWPMEVEEDEEEIQDVSTEGDISINSSTLRASKLEAIGKVNEMARDELESEVKEERRGRKHKDGPCIAREAIENILPSPDQTDVKCTLCPQVCKTRASLKQHYLRCHLERRFQCMVCGKRYGMLKELASHKLTHNRRHQCPSCDMKFATQFLLDGHMDRKHINPKKKPEENQHPNTVCQYCKFEAKSKKSLRDHINRLHGEKTHQCPICDKKFALGKDLNQHVKSHTEIFQCEECGKTLKSKLALKLHISSIHHGIKLTKEKEYVCEDCGKICRNKTHFKEHLNKAHLHVKPFSCEVCHQAFYSKHALKCHGYTHAETREFICEFCSKGFKSRAGLRVHRITHRDVNARPYSCSTCSKTFTQRGALVRHERIHSGDRPYKCQLCDASFNDYSILRRHLVGVHKVDDRSMCGRANIDPDSLNRGRPKLTGPSPSKHMPLAEPHTESTEPSQILSKVAQITIEPSDGSMAQTIEATADAHYALVEPAQRLYQLSTPGDDHSYTGITPKVVRDPVVSSAHVQIETTQPHTEEAVELIQLSDLSPTQLMQQHHQILHHHQQQQQQQQQTMNVVVNDIVHSALYEHHLDSGGSYTIGMPVFPTPTTVGSMHMMQPVQPIARALPAPPALQPQQPQKQPQQQQQTLNQNTAP